MVKRLLKWGGHLRDYFFFVNLNTYHCEKNIKSGKYTREITECRHNGMCNENLLNNKIDIDNTDFIQKDKWHMTQWKHEVVVFCVINKQLPWETWSILLNGGITSPVLKCTFLLLFFCFSYDSIFILGRCFLWFFWMQLHHWKFSRWHNYSSLGITIL